MRIELRPTRDAFPKQFPGGPRIVTAHMPLFNAFVRVTCYVNKYVVVVMATMTTLPQSSRKQSKLNTKPIKCGYLDRAFVKAVQ